MPPFRTGPQPHRRAGLRRSHRGPHAGDSACHSSRKCRDGQRAGVGRARRRSRKHRPAGWEGLRLPRWSGTWRWPWSGRRGGGECWESPTGVALTQEPVAEGPRQVCPPLPPLSSSPALGSWGRAQAKAGTAASVSAGSRQPAARSVVAARPCSSFRARRDNAWRHGCFGDRADPHPPTSPLPSRSSPEACDWVSCQCR